MRHVKHVQQLIIGGLVVLLATACTQDISDPGLDHVEEVAAVNQHRNGLRVASWNVYLGGDIAPVFAADFSDPAAVTEAASTVWNQVQSSGIPERARAIVDRLAEERPHLVGLQEAFQFVELDGSFTPIAPPLDMLAEIEAEISSRGLPYHAVAVQAATSSALPVRIDFSTLQVDRWVAFTDRIVMLVRDDVDVEGTAQGTYAATFPLAEGLDLTRGWIRTEVHHRGRVFQVVNTHLEGQSLAPIQALQVDELLASIAVGHPGTTILMGDLNSDAAAGPGAPSWTPSYDRLIDAGFIDSWVRARPRKRRGFTCCQDPDLRNSASVADQRIDFVLIGTDAKHRGRKRFRGRIRSTLIGEDPEDKTVPNGLWPSDHAGLVTELVLPKRPAR
ncbi:MAG: endonuclease/exonuclease/phosphatase family protein [Longimicrobiales bacterium]